MKSSLGRKSIGSGLIGRGGRLVWRRDTVRRGFRRERLALGMRLLRWGRSGTFILIGFWLSRNRWNRRKIRGRGGKTMERKGKN